MNELIFCSAIFEKNKYKGNPCPNLFLKGGLKEDSASPASVTFTTMSDNLLFFHDRFSGEQLNFLWCLY